MPFDQSFTSTKKPVQRDEAVVSVERCVFRTQNDQDQRSVEGSNFREFLQGRLILPFKERTKLEEDCQMLKLSLNAEIGNEENPNTL